MPFGVLCVTGVLKMSVVGKAEMIESLFGCVVVWFVVGTLSFQKQKNQY